MQQVLAKRLLFSILGWDNVKIEKYSELIGNFAELKYDEYQQYKPGNRFVEHLCAWLNQFEKGRERDIAFNFLFNNLVFISSSEMHHLIETAYHELILPLFTLQADIFCKDDNVLRTNIQSIINLIQTKSLFFALSDGARIDVMRRIALLEHDQVFTAYELADTKYNEIIREMKNRVITMELSQKIVSKLPEEVNHVFLIDDFSGSGISYLRIEDGQWKGKIARVLERLEKENIIGNNSKTKIHIILYLATQKAFDYINNEIENFKEVNKLEIEINVKYVQLINKVILTREEESLFLKHYKSVESEVADSHYKKGNMDYPHHGFDCCSLALVIHHNTPNNSFPVIWAGEHALFPRIKRHKDVN